MKGEFSLFPLQTKFAQCWFASISMESTDNQHKDLLINVLSSGRFSASCLLNTSPWLLCQISYTAEHWSWEWVPLLCLTFEGLTTGIFWEFSYASCWQFLRLSVLQFQCKNIALCEIMQWLKILLGFVSLDLSGWFIFLCWTSIWMNNKKRMTFFSLLTMMNEWVKVSSIKMVVPNAVCYPDFWWAVGGSLHVWGCDLELQLSLLTMWNLYDMYS